MAIYEEASLEGKRIKLDNEEKLVYLKLGFIGPRTLEQVEYLPLGTLSFFRGFFINGKFEELRAELHKLIDQACDAHEEARKQNG